MKFYTKNFLQSALFYDMFYLPNISLEHYIIRENCYRKLGTHEEAIEIVNDTYISHCHCFFKENVRFHENLSKYIFDKNGKLKKLDEYIFFKLRFFGTKFLDIENENRNFFEEERKKFKEKNYPKAIITLAQSRFHDANVIFDFKDNVLQLVFNPGDYEERFGFYGVENWRERGFMIKDPILLIEELYEESQGVFVYNTLWYHEDINESNHSELSIKFTNLIQIK